MIERALKEIHFSVDPMKGAKQQALAALPKLQTIFPIMRAAMRFKFTVPGVGLYSAVQVEVNSVGPEL
jgi:ribosome maturation protein SDO1